MTTETAIALSLSTVTDSVQPIAGCGATDTLFRVADQHVLSNVVPGGGVTVQLPPVS